MKRKVTLQVMTAVALASQLVSAPALAAEPFLSDFAVEMDSTQIGQAEPSVTELVYGGEQVPPGAIRPSLSTSGAYHTVMVKEDGTLWGWGDNTYGQLGLGHNQAVPGRHVKVPGIDHVAAVTTGYDYTLAQKTDGTVWAWGNNRYGQLGDGTEESHYAPVQLPDLTDVKSLTASVSFALALKEDGTVWGWGDNTNGQLGTGTFSHTATPFLIPDLDSVVQVASGNCYSAALKNDGTVMTWGCMSADPGQPYYQPHPVPGLENVQAIYGGGNNAYALKSDGTVYTWDYDRQPVQVPGLSGIVKLDSSTSHTLALTADGDVYAWGDNTAGELGLGHTERQETPVLVPDLSNIASISAQPRHSFAVTRENEVYAWGRNFNGQLGDGTNTDRHEPVLIHLVPHDDQLHVDTDSIYLPVGRSQQLSVTQAAYDGTVDDVSEQATYTVEDETIATIDAQGLVRARSVGATTATVEYGGQTILVGIHVWSLPQVNHSMNRVLTSPGFMGHSGVIKPDGTLWMWGANSYGQLGNGTTDDSSTPVQASGLTDVQAVEGGTNYTLALRQDGTVWAWGSNDFGQLGIGNKDSQTTPVHVQGLSHITAISASNHTLALRADGTVWAWGVNYNGQLGNGTTEDSTTPVQVQDLSDVTYIYTNQEQSFAVKQDGTVWMWGSDYFSLNGGAPLTTPVQIPVFDDAIAVSSGFLNIAVLKTDGSVWTWGSNYMGQLGNGNGQEQNTMKDLPRKVADGIAAIRTENNHTFALKANGTVLSWGNNDFGQLGYETTPSEIYNMQDIPKQLPSLTDVIALSTGETHTIAMKANGTIWTWGGNFGGQLGNGTTDGTATPTLISIP
ncbi:Ig-like domain-containing protein [Brevibacillus dissolubilis]|uniref:RCC1 domain-containing protein n=1 Tax=Brevibacillus dissolubilis TaxID=1844116 RepID=UPI001116D91A|nr:Ig-like domain-containing protein [Brevibacillus dissolubilis]